MTLIFVTFSSCYDLFSNEALSIPSGKNDAAETIPSYPRARECLTQQWQTAPTLMKTDDAVNEDHDDDVVYGCVTAVTKLVVLVLPCYRCAPSVPEFFQYFTEAYPAFFLDVLTEIVCPF